MKYFKKILCPVDFSEPSRNAFLYAKKIADAFESELVLLHVAPNITEAYTALMPDFPTFGIQKEEQLVEQFNEFVDDWSGKLKKVIRAGTPYIEILDFEEKNKFDLIVLGAKGHTKFERLFLGTTGEKVTRKAKCPVLTVHQTPRDFQIKKILLPIDFSAISYEILPTISAIADKFNSEIDLLHVVETGHHIDKTSQEEEYRYFEKIKERLSEEWELPEKFSSIECRKFIRHHSGSAGYGVLEFAQDWGVDLIAMTTHGRSGFSKALLGSVTEKVIKIATCPVLSMRSKFK